MGEARHPKGCEQVRGPAKPRSAANLSERGWSQRARQPVRIVVPFAGEIANPMAGCGLFHILRIQRHLAEAAGNIEHIGRLRQAGQPRPQGPRQRQPLFDADAKMRGARRQVGMMQIIRLDAVLDKGAHQVGQRLDIVIDALQQHALADQRDLGFAQPRNGRPRLRRKFAGMIGMDRHPGGDAGRDQGGDQFVAHPRRIDHRHAGVPAHDLDMGHGGKTAGDLACAARRKNEGIAAGEDHFPDFRMGGDIVHGARQIRPATARWPCRARCFRGGNRNGNRPGRTTPP